MTNAPRFTRRTLLSSAASGGLLAMLPLRPLRAAGLEEPPSLQALVEAGELPPMRERLPKTPKTIDFEAEGKRIGRYGGRLRTLLGKAKDSRIVVVIEYSRLIGFNTKLEIEPDILESFDSVENREFTLKIREGHRWSDGHPLTSEDFRYWWEDVATDPKLNEGAIDPAMISGGEKPEFTIVDELTVRYRWSVPNPAFPLALAGASPLYVYMPAHYMKQFHIKYADREKLEAKVRRKGVADWSALHTRMGRMYRDQNPNLPVLEPWQNTTADATQRAVFKRNPYFHRVDPEGRQLPYIDEVIASFGSTEIIPAETAAGQSDLQARYLQFDNYTVLRQAEANHDFDVRLWTEGTSSGIALYPNMNVKDPAWNALMNDVRFRRALSIGLDRHELNEQLYFGLAKPGNNTVLRESPLYEPIYDKLWTAHDPSKANGLLDSIGLDKRDDDGVRLLPDGRPMELVVESAGERIVETDAMELIRYHWRDLGIKVFVRSLQRDLLRRRYLNGQTKISISNGLDIGLATADSNPEELAPVSSVQANWPVWGQFFETRGRAGEKPPPGEVGTLLALYGRWRTSQTTEERRDIWARMLRLYADQVFSIGIAGEMFQPVVVNRKLRNIPEKGLYSWKPTAFFGVYRPDTFYFERG